jgi:predicted DNA-binding protein YlxM (UPF0122 family)
MPKNGRMKLRDIKRLLKLHYSADLSVRQIGRSLNKPKSTVSDYITRFEASSLALEDLNTKTAEEIYAALFPVAKTKISKSLT